MANGFSIDTGITEIDQLLSRGGMASMLPTLWLIIGAVTFGVLLEEFGLMDRLIDPLIAAARTPGTLFLSVFACAFGLNVFAGDQYIALVLPEPGVPHHVRRPGPRTHQPSPARRRQRHRHLPAGAVELVRCVHGGRARRVDAPLRALRRLLLRQPHSSASCTASPGSSIEKVEPLDAAKEHT